jgi:ApbE family
MFRNRNIIYSIVLIILMLAVYWYRKQDQETLISVYIEGPTMGTEYHIKYAHSQGLNYQKEIDSILVAFNQCLSTYIPESEISTFNRVDTVYFKRPFFAPVLRKSKEIHAFSQGAFDPTVLPLVRAWGFGPSPKDSLSEKHIDSLLQFVNFEHIGFDEKKVWKQKKGVQLDFNAIAQGYASDVVADFLEKQDVSNYMIEIGGEVLAKRSQRRTAPSHRSTERQGSGHFGQLPQILCQRRQKIRPYLEPENRPARSTQFIECHSFSSRLHECRCLRHRLHGRRKRQSYRIVLQASLSRYLLDLRRKR